MGYKAYSDGYLMSLTKTEIIELLRTAEHNFFATEEALNNSAKAGMEIAEKFEKAKRLLKAAVEDFRILGTMLEDGHGHCTAEIGCHECVLGGGNLADDCQWRHEAESLTLIGGEEQ